MADETGVEIAKAESGAAAPDYTELTQAVRDLVQVMHQGELERLEVSQGDLRILLCARSANSNTHVPETPAPAATGAPETSPGAVEGDIHYHHITSPMVGTFYEAPAPGEPPFVRPGDAVEVGQTVAIIEAMKIMNEIVADRSGIVHEVLVENGETVEYGHPIFRLRPA